MMTDPTSLLETLLSKPTPTRLIVSGEIGIGKTTWCSAFVDLARARGLTVAGLLSPPVFEAGQKTAIDLVDLASGERRRLAHRRAIPDERQATRNWAFDPDVLAWGDAILGAIQPADLLLIDELGQLELRHNGGWQNALPVLARGDYKVGCAVVRHWLLDDILGHFPAAQVIHITASGRS